MAMALNHKELWQKTFDAAKARGLCDFDASREADHAITDAAVWELIKLDAPLPVRPLTGRLPLSTRAA